MPALTRWPLHIVDKAGFAAWGDAQSPRRAGLAGRATLRRQRRHRAKLGAMRTGRSVAR
jgi:hypothetical protein